MRIVLGSIVMLDGLVSALWGTSFLHQLRRVAPPSLRPLFAGFSRLPEPLFRLGAALQAAAGMWIILGATTPREESSPTSRESCC